MPAIVLEGKMVRTTVLRRRNGTTLRGHLFVPNEKQPRKSFNFGPLFLRAATWSSPNTSSAVEFRGSVYHNKPPMKSAVHEVSECRGGFKKQCKAAILLIRIN